MTKPEIKNIIRELVGFERQFINPIDWDQTRFGGISKIYFQAKDFFYVLSLNTDETFELSFADAPSYTVEADETEPTEETVNA